MNYETLEREFPEKENGPKEKKGSFSIAAFNIAMLATAPVWVAPLFLYTIGKDAIKSKYDRKRLFDILTGKKTIFTQL